MTSTQRLANLLRVIPVLLVAEAATGQSFEAAFEGPSADRWNYGFNVTPGTRPVASVFGYTGDLYEFDDRDGQVIIAFDTSTVIAPGAGADRYVVDTFTIELMLADPLAGGYDPTVDDWRTHLASADPLYLPDADPGRPIELYATGFRNRVDEADWTESSDFSPGRALRRRRPKRIRRPMHARWTVAGRLELHQRGVHRNSNRHRHRGRMVPGRGTPRGYVAARSRSTARIPAAAAWLSRSLNEGRLLFSVSSLVEAEQEGGDFIDLYLRENPLVQVGVRQCGDARDFAGESLDRLRRRLATSTTIASSAGGDLGIFLAFWGTDNPETDLNR